MLYSLLLNRPTADRTVQPTYLYLFIYRVRLRVHSIQLWFLFFFPLFFTWIHAYMDVVPLFRPHGKKKNAPSPIGRAKSGWNTHWQNGRWTHFYFSRLLRVKLTDNSCVLFTACLYIDAFGSMKSWVQETSGDALSGQHYYYSTARLLSGSCANWGAALGANYIPSDYILVNVCAEIPKLP